MQCFTIADSRYCAQVAILARSLNFWHPDIRLICFTTDGHGVASYDLDTPLDIRSIPEQAWVKNDPVLADRIDSLEGLARGAYFKPIVFQQLLRQSHGPLIFLDPDLWLTGAIPELFSLGAGGEWPCWFERGELLLTPHLMTPPATRNRVQRELNILVSGTFNAGLIACRPTPAVVAFVQWWAGRVQEWHGHDQAAGLYWDQKWLDFAPVHVPLTWIIRDPGINLGHWRLPEAPPVSQCRLLHSSGFRPDQPEQISRYTLHLDSGEVPAGYRELFIRYGQLLKHPGMLSVLGTSLPAATQNWRASPPAPPDDQSRIAFATAAAKSEWALVRTLWESFHHHHPDIPFFVLLTDEPDGFFDPDREPFEVLRLDDLALDDKAALARSMDRMEFTYALTPDLLLAIHRKGFGRACFLKQESLVVASMLDVASQLAGCSILLTPHLPAALTGETGFSREANILQSGIYNVGFIGVRDTQEGSRFLEWWRDRVHQSCRRNVQEGLHFEQRWLDLVPCYFEGVDFVRDKGFNIGHWNLPELSIDLRAGRFFHSDGVCSFFRLSGFDYDQPAETSRYRRSLTLDRIGSAAEVFRAYRAGLSRHGYRNSRHWPWHFQASPGTPPRRWWRRLASALRRSLCGPLPARFPSGMRFPAPLVRWRRRIKARRQ